MSYISSDHLGKINNELRERKTAMRQDIARRIDEAKSLGDLSENMEYTAAKEAQAFNEGRILELEKIVREATIISGHRHSKKEVGFGSVVDVQLNKNGRRIKQSFVIVGSQEADPLAGKISDESPLGKAFLSKKLGDIIEVETPKGKATYKIISIK